LARRQSDFPNRCAPDGRLAATVGNPATRAPAGGAFHPGLYARPDRAMKPLPVAREIVWIRERNSRVCRDRCGLRSLNHRAALRNRGIALVAVRSGRGTSSASQSSERNNWLLARSLALAPDQHAIKDWKGLADIDLGREWQGRREAANRFNNGDDRRFFSHFLFHLGS
jgi:hypothetical protein